MRPVPGKVGRATAVTAGVQSATLPERGPHPPAGRRHHPPLYTVLQTLSPDRPPAPVTVVVVAFARVAAVVAGNDAHVRVGGPQHGGDHVRGPRALHPHAQRVVLSAVAGQVRALRVQVGRQFLQEFLRKENETKRLITRLRTESLRVTRGGVCYRTVI